MVVSGERDNQAALFPGKRPFTNCTGECVGHRPVWKDAEKLAPHRYSIPRPFNPKRAAVPTALSQSTHDTPCDVLKVENPLTQSVSDFTQFAFNDVFCSKCILFLFITLILCNTKLK
jgi:hypothetical protein